MTGIQRSISDDGLAERASRIVTTGLKEGWSLALRLHPTFLRLIGIFLGAYLMGAHAFFMFYFVHMLLKSMKVMFYIDSDIIIKREIRRNLAVSLRYLLHVIALNCISSVLILASYWSVLSLFDKVIAPQAIDMGFAKLYALTIIGNILIPLDGLIRSQAGPRLGALLLRSDNLMTLLFIAGFVIAGIDGALLPYAWLLASLAMSAVTVLFGLVFLIRLNLAVGDARLNRIPKRTVWQQIAACSLKNTQNRAAFLMAKGAISTFLGPFAGLTLKAVRFTRNDRRQEYFSKLQKRRLFKRIDRRIPDTVKDGVTMGRLLGLALVAAAVIVAALIVLRGTMDALVLLGMLVLASKLLAISARFLVLQLIVPPPDEASAREEQEEEDDEDGLPFDRR